LESHDCAQSPLAKRRLFILRKSAICAILAYFTICATFCPIPAQLLWDW
jgi:hypothetical protein